MLLNNKTAVITGCNKGIGKKILEVFSENGAKIYACVRKIDNDFNNQIKIISQNNKNIILPIELDLENLTSLKNAANSILEMEDKIDILINNAGIIENSLIQMTKNENLKKIFEVNFFSLTEFKLHCERIIKNRNGSITYISSTSALDNPIGRGSYSASKAAVISHAQTLSRELGRSNIRVNTIAPGLTETDMMRNNTNKKIIDEVVSKLSIKRIAMPKEIANVALFLSSDLASYITGQTIRVDGGM